MMNDIVYLNRLTGKQEVEKVYKGNLVQLLYGNHWLSCLLRPSLIPLLCKWPFFSALYGYFQKLPWSARKIQPFIDMFNVDTSEFLEPVSHYRSFNDFFIRRLKPEARPLASGEEKAIIPADGRYYVYQDIDSAEGFVIKGQKFNLTTLLEDENLASAYQGGGMVIARLCPSDYHRFHFPCDCLPGETRWINGWLYSVNPIAIKRDLNIFTKNKRTVCELQTKTLGRVLYLEIGATNVGSIQETYTPLACHAKGVEKGYFEFGGSALILLFAKGTIQFDSDLLEATQKGLETRCLMGQSMGTAINLVRQFAL
jgi:phosphatidylserine decarboxylase